MKLSLNIAIPDASAALGQHEWWLGGFPDEQSLRERVERLRTEDDLRALIGRGSVKGLLLIGRDDQTARARMVWRIGRRKPFRLELCSEEAACIPAVVLKRVDGWTMNGSESARTWFQKPGRFWSDCTDARHLVSLADALKIDQRLLTLAVCAVARGVLDEGDELVPMIDRAQAWARGEADMASVLALAVPWNGKATVPGHGLVSAAWCAATSVLNPHHVRFVVEHMRKHATETVAMHPLIPDIEAFMVKRVREQIDLQDVLLALAMRQWKN